MAFAPYASIQQGPVFLRTRCYERITPPPGPGIQKIRVGHPAKDREIRHYLRSTSMARHDSPIFAFYPRPSAVVFSVAFTFLRPAPPH
jgi:hypothetical protein